SRAFAGATNQEFHFYYSSDTKGLGKCKHLLQNAAAIAAWNAPVKSAGDLSGCLPLIPGMPVFLTVNLATELGLSNGSEGTLVSVKYELRHGRHYTISAEVDIHSYTN
ncbi:hypothetical protein K439DRAFT_1244574, partial [Ramaria rubella]